MTMMMELMIQTIMVDDGDVGFPQGFWVEWIDRVPVSVSEWLLGSFALILSNPIFTSTETAMLSRIGQQLKWPHQRRCVLVSTL